MEADVVVIGGGPGGLACAQTTASGGLKTILVDSGPLGGTCVNRGCVPAKTWLSSAHILKNYRWAEKIGLGRETSGGVSFAKLKSHTRDVISLLQKGAASSLKKAGVEVIAGRAAFLSDRKIGINDGERVITFKRAVIAVGSKPIELFGRGPGFYDTDGIFEISELPKSVVIVGGGAVGVEMASFFSALACEVSVVEAMDEILPFADQEVTGVLKREFKKNGVTLLTGAKISNAWSDGGVCKMELEDGRTMNSEAVVIAAGRKPNLAGLGLDKAGVAVGIGGNVEVDEAMSTTRGGIFAVGDAAGKRQLAYTAHHEGLVAGRNMLGRPSRMDYRAVPSIVFSGPEIACIGPTENQMARTGVKTRVGRHHVRALARAQACGETTGMFKVIEGEDHSILAVHIASPYATEIIHGAVTAMRAGMTVAELAGTVFGHPTFSEGISLAAEDAIRHG